MTRRGHALLLLLGTTGAIRLHAAELSGIWAGTVSPEGSAAITITLTLRSNERGLSGSAQVQGDPTPSAIQEATMRDGIIGFRVKTADRSMEFRLTQAGSVLEGEVAVDERTVHARFTPAVFRVGGGVTSPILIHKTNPEYTDEARFAMLEGTVVLAVQIDPEGQAVNIRVLHPLGMGLNEKAIECVRQWRFRPAMKDGLPVQVEAQIEVNFRNR
jgi:TonB family protein